MLSTPNQVFALWVHDFYTAALLCATQQAGDPLNKSEILQQPAVVTIGPKVARANKAAAINGIQVGMSLRSAQNLLPQIVHSSINPARDNLFTQQILHSLQEFFPAATQIFHGLYIVPASGAIRYYGSKEKVIAAFDAALQHLPVDQTASLASSIFAASCAARLGIQEVDATQTSQFLATIPLDMAITDQRTLDLLNRLGATHFRDIQAIPDETLVARFGWQGTALAALALGQDTHEALQLFKNSHTLGTTTQTTQALAESTAKQAAQQNINFDTPLATSTQAVFGMSQAVDTFVNVLHRYGYVCSEISIAVHFEARTISERCHSIAGYFTASDILNRLRWQLETLETQLQSTSEITDYAAHITAITLTPISISETGEHAPQLWQSNASIRMQHHLDRLQQKHGQTAVGVFEYSGGRTLAERYTRVPWGMQSTPRKQTKKPLDEMPSWLAALPAPHPSTVFRDPPRVQLLTQNKTPARITPQGLWEQPPTEFLTTRTDSRAPEAVIAWSQPWAIKSHWWNEEHPFYRAQIVTASKTAWVLVNQHGAWFAEGAYS